jgi:hypothetical protein
MEALSAALTCLTALARDDQGRISVIDSGGISMWVARGSGREAARIRSSDQAPRTCPAQ